MAVDRYGRPLSQQANPYNDQPNNNPAYKAPQQPGQQYSNAQQGAQAPQPNQNTGVWGGMAQAGAHLAQQQAQPQQPPQQQQAVGHDGSYNGQSRDQWRDAWMGQGQMTPQAADQWLQSNGATQVNGKNGTWTTPYGDTLDLQIGRGAAMANGGMITPGWTGQGGGAPGGAPGAPGGPMGGGMMTPAQSAGVPGFGVSGGKFSYGGISMPGSYQPGHLPTGQLPTYQGSQINQFNAPNQQPNESAMSGMIGSLLGSQGSMPPEVVAAMQAKQAEQANAGYGSAVGAMQQQQAGRGFDNGGQADAALRRLGDSRTAQIMQGNRDIGIQAAQTNFNDRLNALGAAGGAMTGQMGRATTGYDTGLKGQLSQADENYKQFGSQADQTKFALQQALSQEGLNRQGSQDAFSQWLAGAQLGEGGRQFDLSNFLDQQRVGNQNAQYYAGLGQNQNQFNSNMDLNWQQFGDQRQNNLLRFLYPNGLQ